MAKTYRIGVLGLSHDHVWDTLRELRQTGRGTLVAAADPHLELRDQVRQEHGCAVYPDCEMLLDREQLDAVFIYADNASGADLTEQAAGRGLHVLIEKPMAADLRGADRMLAAARQNNVRLMVNWPFAWWPQMQHALRLARQGTVGALWQVKYRAAHAGPRELGCSKFFCDWLYDPKRNGAGALMDYCCYGAALARCLLGTPSRVLATAGRLCKEDILMEDNGIIIMSYPHALAVAEGSWTQIGNLTAYMTAIYGTKGTLLVEPRQGGRLLLATAEQPEGRPLEVPAIEGGATASAHFLSCLESGQPIFELCSDRVARDAQEILEAGLQAARLGHEVPLPLPIGIAPS
jgi:predicted dehydrogenase